jgi:acyl-CoA thioester hydrolase
MDTLKFNHQYSVQIRFVDIDAFGHVNNAVFASYYETARVAYFDEVLGLRINWKKNGLILAKNILEYKLPVYLRDTIICRTAVVKLGNKSIEIFNELIRKNNNLEEIVASAHGILVCYDYENNETIEIPSEWRELIQRKESLN